MGLKCSEITEIVMLFQYSEISFVLNSSDFEKPMLMTQKM